MLSDRLELEMLVPSGAILEFGLSRSITLVWDSICSMSFLILWLSFPSPVSPSLMGNTCLLSPSLPTLMRLLPRGDLGLYLYLYLFSCACIFNSLGIYAQILAFFSSDLHGICACIFNSPGGYVHKFCILLFWLACDLCLHIQFLEDMCTSSVFFWLMRKSLMCDLLGKITLLRNVLMAHGKAVLVILTYEEASDGV